MLAPASIASIQVLAPVRNKNLLSAAGMQHGVLVVDSLLGSNPIYLWYMLHPFFNDDE
jgi:hypothetical protein